MPNWRLMVEIIWYSNAYLYTYNINNTAFKCPFLAISNVRLRLIQGYKIETGQDW